MTQNKKLFIDDERFPPDDGESWQIVRSSSEAIDYVSTRGVPSFISFDHDLGGNDTSVVFIKWLVDYLIDTDTHLPSDFTYYVHSQNSVGRDNVEGYMTNIIKHFKP